jgi:hypothetical protein
VNRSSFEGTSGSRSRFAGAKLMLDLGMGIDVVELGPHLNNLVSRRKVELI